MKHLCRRPWQQQLELCWRAVAIRSSTMTRITNNRPNPPKGPTPRGAEKKPKLTRQKLERMTEDQAYLAMRSRYLADNPQCVHCCQRATEVHHLQGGPNRRVSLTNTNTWLEVCGNCHRVIEAMDKPLQVLIKMLSVQRANERYRQ